MEGEDRAEGDGWRDGRGGRAKRQKWEEEVEEGSEEDKMKKREE